VLLHLSITGRIIAAGLEMLIFRLMLNGACDTDQQQQINFIWIFLLSLQVHKKL